MPACMPLRRTLFDGQCLIGYCLTYCKSGGRCNSYGNLKQSVLNVTINMLS